MELLPEVEHERRAGFAQDILAREASELDATTLRDVVDATLKVLSAPVAAVAFAPGSRAEVPIVGRIGSFVVAGEVDRLAVTSDEVILIDYKTNRNPPSDAGGIPAVYYRQMAAYRAVLNKMYPDKSISCFILWTEGPSLIRLDDGLLEETENDHLA